MTDIQNGTHEPKPAENQQTIDTAKSNFEAQKSAMLDKIIGDGPKEVSNADDNKQTPNTSAKKWKISDTVELDETEIKPLLKIYGKEKIEDADAVVSELTNARKWKQEMVEKGQKFNAEKAEYEARVKAHQAKEEEFVNRQKQLKEDLVKETTIEKDYSDKVNAILSEIKAKKEELDRDDINAVDAFDDFKFQKQTEIATLQLEKKQALQAHKEYMERAEREVSERNANLVRQNLVELSTKYSDEYDADKIFAEAHDFNDLSKEKQKDPKTLETYPAYKKYVELVKFASENQQISLAKAQELRVLRQIASDFDKFRLEVDKVKADAEKAGYDKAVAEIKLKGRSFFESTDDKNKPITTNTVPKDKKEYQKQKDNLLARVFH